MKIETVPMSNLWSDGWSKDGNPTIGERLANYAFGAASCYTTTLGVVTGFALIPASITAGAGFSIKNQITAAINGHQHKEDDPQTWLAKKLAEQADKQKTVPWAYGPTRLDEMNPFSSEQNHSSAAHPFGSILLSMFTPPLLAADASNYLGNKFLQAASHLDSDAKNLTRVNPGCLVGIAAAGVTLVKLAPVVAPAAAAAFVGGSFATFGIGTPLLITSAEVNYESLPPYKETDKDKPKVLPANNNKQTRADFYSGGMLPTTFSQAVNDQTSGITTAAVRSDAGTKNGLGYSFADASSKDYGVYGDRGFLPASSQNETDIVYNPMRPRPVAAEGLQLGR